MTVADTPPQGIFGYLLAARHLTFRPNGVVAWIEGTTVEQRHRRFGIDHRGGERIFHGCAGFDLERLAYAFRCRHGIDPQPRPTAVPGR